MLVDVMVMLEFPAVVVETEAEAEDEVKVVEVRLVVIVEIFPTFLRSPNKLIYAPSPPQYSLKSPLQRYWQKVSATFSTALLVPHQPVHSTKLGLSE